MGAKPPSEPVQWQLLRYAPPLASIAGFDYLAGAQISLWLLYLVPVGLATWNRGLHIGVTVGLGAMALLLVDALVIGGPFAAAPFALFAALCCAVVLAGEIWVLSMLRRRDVERVIQPAAPPVNNDR